MDEKIVKNILVEGDAGDIFRLWADFENFPHFMKYIRSVKKTGPRTSHWVMEGPLGRKIEWDAETTRLEENKRIAWSTKDRNDESDITTSGQVTFNQLPDNRTEITVTLHYVAPVGRLGTIAGAIFADPEERLEEDLRNFKKYAEGRHEQIRF
jgi:uncharacterized membrane protein